ncbi:hypothetical protein FOZ62_006284, partial [Perkinsus olseni]
MTTRGYIRKVYSVDPESTSVPRSVPGMFKQAADRRGNSRMTASEKIEPLYFEKQHQLGVDRMKAKIGQRPREDAGLVRYGSIHDVVGYVESTADYPLPLCVKSALSDEEMRSILVYLLRVKVREDWQNKKVGSTMLPGALEDIRRTWPSAVGVHLLVVDDNHFAIKLYEKLNFTDVGGENRSALLGTAHGNVVGYEESTADYPLLLCIKTTLSDKEKRGMVIYILRVKVREDWQNKKVGTMMLPKALKN